MFILIKGNPIDGFKHYGPFEDSNSAISWGTHEFQEDPDWWFDKLENPDPNFNDDEIGDGEAIDLNDPEMAHLKEQILAIQGRSAASMLPKEILVDLSEIPEGI